MPYPDSEYPSILRGRTKRESQRLLAAAPELLAACEQLIWQVSQMQKMFDDGDGTIAAALSDARMAVSKARGE